MESPKRNKLWFVKKGVHLGCPISNPKGSDGKNLVRRKYRFKKKTLKINF